MVRIDETEIKKQMNFAATASAGVDNNSIFLDSADNAIKIKDNSGSIGGVGGGVVPVGAVVPWLKSLTGTPATLPDNFVECNGQTISDADSPYDGVALPNLNGNAQFLYGAATSGGAKTENFLPNHKHEYTYNTWVSGPTCFEGSASSVTGTRDTFIHNTTAGTAWAGYAVVMIMRIK